MSTFKSRLDLSDVEISKSGVEAALNVVNRLTRQKEDAEQLWMAAIRLAQDNGASLREIAAVAGISPQTVSTICKH